MEIRGKKKKSSFIIHMIIGGAEEVEEKS